MASRRIVLAQGMAAIALILTMINNFGSEVLQVNMMITGTLGLALSTTAFFVSWKKRSILVSALLVVNGAIFTTVALIATRYFAIIIVPGPILGVIFGSWVLVLGIIKGRTTGMAIKKIMATTGRNK